MKMRVNPLSPNYSMQQKIDLPPKRVRDFIGKYKPRQRSEHEDLPPQIDVMKRQTYKTGDGDTPAFYRPGSQDFLKHKSKLFGGEE